MALFVFFTQKLTAQTGEVNANLPSKTKNLGAELKAFCKRTCGVSSGETHLRSLFAGASLKGSPSVLSFFTT